MIFCRTKIDCDNLEAFMRSISGKKGPMIDTEFSCVVVHSDRQQRERTANLQAFKDGEARFLICTDVAARGLDIRGLPYMINYTLPDKAEDFIHRCGRVGRAERMGLAISIVGAFPEKVWYHSCNNKSCTNTKLTTDGGCGLWWDEQSYWTDIQTRLGVNVPQLDRNFQLPTMMKDDKVTYGQKKEGGEAEVFRGHAEQLKPAVQQLALLEDAAQKQYWALKAKFARKR